MRTTTVHKLDAQGTEVRRYSGRILRRSKASVTLEAVFALDDIDLGLLLLRRGDRMVETFYADRWYNVFVIFEGGSRNRKGWYCNLTRPARLEQSDIYSEDLALDVLVSADGTIRLMDEAEFASLDLSPTERSEVRRAVEELRDLATRGAAPFSRASRPRGQRSRADRRAG